MLKKKKTKLTPRRNRSEEHTIPLRTRGRRHSGSRRMFVQKLGAQGRGAGGKIVVSRVCIDPS